MQRMEDNGVTQAFPKVEGIETTGQPTGVAETPYLVPQYLPLAALRYLAFVREWRAEQFVQHLVGQRIVALY